LLRVKEWWSMGNGRCWKRGDANPGSEPAQMPVSECES
jgi:hypothetical protein